MNDIPKKDHSYHDSLAKLVRYYILTSTTAAGSGHPTTALSATDLMTLLMFAGYFRADLNNPEYPNNDRLIFSKGHAAPLLYALYALTGKVPTGELETLRKFGSRLEGHPTMQFPYTEVPTGSLGQGLSVGVGMALNAKLDKLSYRTFVLLGDSEMAEGSVWEAIQSAAFYKLDNLVGILDVNRLGQSRETMYGADAEAYQKRISAFGWETKVIDGHDHDEIVNAYAYAMANESQKPYMIIAKTKKGKGVSFLEDKEGWHGKALNKEELAKALEELGEVDHKMVDKPFIGITAPEPNEAAVKADISTEDIKITTYEKPTATRRAYGNALVNVFEAYPNIVVMDGETSNSTYSEIFRKVHPDKYFEMFIAEQNMASVALGFARRGKIPFISTFAAFLTRAFDQIRMAQYANPNLSVENDEDLRPYTGIHPVKSAEGGSRQVGTFNGVKICGSHAGVSIGEDGASQMALEDIAMFRSLLGQVVLYPSDAISTEKLVAAAAAHQGNVYIRTTRKDTAILYSTQNTVNSKQNEGLIYHDFKIGGSCTIKSSEKDQVTVIGAGITLHEALAAHEELQKEGISIRVIDLYSIKPLDVETVKKAAQETKAIITVEDHHHEGGLGEAVNSVLAGLNPKSLIFNLAVTKEPHSAKPDELLAYEEINKDAIVKKVKEIINR